MSRFLVNTDDPSRIAVVTEEGERVSYGELIDRVDEAASGLAAGDLVFALANNELEPLVIYLAALEARAVPLMLEADIQGEKLGRLLEIYEPRLVVMPASHDMDFAGYSKGMEKGRYAYLEAVNYSAPRVHKELALLAATSGSTGDPKLVRISRDNLLSNTRAIADYLELGPQDRAITSLPISYSYGLSVVNSHLFAGGSIVLSNSSMMERAFWQAISDHEVTSFAGVPYNYEMLLKLGLKRLKIPTIRKMTQAGGRLDPEKTAAMLEYCSYTGIRYWTMYGQAEASPRISWVPTERAADKVGSIGIPVPGGKMWIRSESGEDISETGGIGELIYEGPNVCLGYARRRSDLALGDENQGRLATGDLARADSDGYFYLEGRMHRFLKVYGKRISLDQVEAYLARCGLEGAVVGCDDQVMVFLVGAGDAAEETRKDIAKFAGINPAAVSLTMLKNLPRTASGKIDYQDLSK